MGSLPPDAGLLFLSYYLKYFVLYPVPQGGATLLIVTLPKNVYLGVQLGTKQASFAQIWQKKSLLILSFSQLSIWRIHIKESSAYSFSAIVEIHLDYNVLTYPNLTNSFEFYLTGHARRWQTSDGSRVSGRRQEVIRLDCMFSSCQRGRPEHQEQEGPDAARPLPRSEPLQGLGQVPERKLFQVRPTFRLCSLIFF